MYSLKSILNIVLIAFGETLWIQSVQYEVFTMNNMFVCIVLFLAVRFYYAYWNEDFKNRYFFSVFIKS